MSREGKMKTCPNGHQFRKTSDCTSCPVCAAENKPESGLLSLLAAPVRRAFQERGIDSASALSKYSKKEVLSWHGVGPASIPMLIKALKKEDLDFKD